MRAMVLRSVVDLDKNSEPLRLEELPRPAPAADEILVEVSACGVCHTELDEIEGRTPPPANDSRTGLASASVGFTLLTVVQQKT